MLPRLKSFSLEFLCPRFQDHQASEHPPPLTRVVLPKLSFLFFHGDVEDLEVILSQIETPILNRSKFRLFNQLVFHTPLLGRFICRKEIFRKAPRARIQVFCLCVVVRLSELEETADTLSGREALRLELSCEQFNCQRSALVQVLNSLLPLLQNLESLQIEVLHSVWQGEAEAIQFREILHPFTSVKTMTLLGVDTVRLIAPALQELAVARATKVLPPLQGVFLIMAGCQPSGSLKEDIDQFIATRQLDGHPVTFHY